MAVVDITTLQEYSTHVSNDIPTIFNRFSDISGTEKLKKKLIFVHFVQSGNIRHEIQ